MPKHSKKSDKKPETNHSSDNQLSVNQNMPSDMDTSDEENTDTSFSRRSHYLKRNKSDSDDSTSKKAKKPRNPAKTPSPTPPKRSTVPETSTTASTSQINVPTSNQFEVLATINGSTPETPITTAPVNKKAPRPPPITVTSAKYPEIYQIISKHLNNVLYKNTSTGTKIFTTSLEDYNVALGLVRHNKLAYFTHQIPGNKPLKVFLRGLIETDPHDVHLAIMKTYIIPESVFLIPRSNSHNTYRDVKYLVHFDSTKYKISDILAIKAINNQIISWQKVPKRKGHPTFCHNCLEYGHGMSGCGRPSLCLKCGKDHNSKDCKEATFDPNSPHCFKCKLDGHLANHKTCKFRAQYLLAKSKAQGKPTNKGNNNSVKPAIKSNTPILNSQNFPPTLPLSTGAPPLINGNYSGPSFSQVVTHGHLPQNNGHLPKNNSQKIPTVIPGFAGNNSRQQNQNFSQNSNTNSSQNSPQDPIEDPLSAEEAQNLLFDFYQGYSQCKSRFEQIRFITTISLKYLYGSKP